MPTYVKFWKCDICGSRHATRKLAAKCEAQGDGTGDAMPPRGLIHTETARGFRNAGGSHLDPTTGDRFTGIATGEGVRRGPHTVTPTWWWFRGNGCGDDPWGEDTRGRLDVCRGWEARPDTYLEAPAVQRAVAACREMGIDPLVFRGGEIVRLDDVA